MKYLFVIILTFFCFGVYSQERPQETERPSAWSDLGTSCKWLYQGSYKQFNKNNLYNLGVMVPTNWYWFGQDDYVLNSVQGKTVSNTVQTISDLAIFFATPIPTMTLYYIGRVNYDTNMMQYAMETFSAMYLTYIESYLISFIPIHERPDQNNLSWAEELRGNSSFPSGHMASYSVLFAKTLQFYGPYWSLIPLAGAVATGYERVVSEKHYISDVFGGFFLSLLSSEGVRVAGQYKNNNPVFKFIFEHDPKLSFASNGKNFIYNISWSF